MVQQVDGFQESEGLEPERGRSPSGGSNPSLAPPDGDGHEHRAASSDHDDAAVPQDQSPVKEAPPAADDGEGLQLLPDGPRLFGVGTRRRKSQALAKPAAAAASGPLTPEQRLLLLDTWQRSGLPGSEFAELVGVSKHTLYKWKKAFEAQGPAGLMDQPRGTKSGSKLPEVTKRSILMLKQAHPDWGCQRISDALLRGPALPASPGAVAKVLHEAGYEAQEQRVEPHAPPVRRFERATPNQLWQTDLFTFVLRRQNRRVYLVGFMDDYSRFIVGYGLHATQSAALVIEVLRAAITSYGAPQELLSDNGAQYVTWRGKSAFARELEQRGVKHIVARPRHPQTLGKIERFWGTMWRECLQSAVFLDLGDAQRRIGLFIDHYNFQRPHQAMDGLVPADRFFHAAPEVLKTLKSRVAANALEVARNGEPRPPFYVTGHVGGKPFSLHAEGERVILSRPGEERREVDLDAPPQVISPQGQVDSRLTEPLRQDPPEPGVSAVDELGLTSDLMTQENNRDADDAGNDQEGATTRTGQAHTTGVDGDAAGPQAGGGDAGGAGGIANAGTGGGGAGDLHAQVLPAGEPGAGGTGQGVRATDEGAGAITSASGGAVAATGEAAGGSAASPAGTGTGGTAGHRPQRQVQQQQPGAAAGQAASPPDGAGPSAGPAAQE